MVQIPCCKFRVNKMCFKIISVISFFAGLLLAIKAKYIPTSTPNIDLNSTEIVSSTSGNETESTSTSIFDSPTSTDSNDNNEPEISLEDLLKKFNITEDSKTDPDKVEGFLPYLPYIILTVVVLGLVYVVKMFLDFMKFCAKFYNKLPKFASKGVQTSDTENTTPKEMETNF